jgi:hypothetical protein
VATATASVAMAAAAAASAAAPIDISGAVVRPQRYSYSMISIVLPGVAAKKGEDPAVNGSYGREKGGGVEDNNNNKCREGGGRRQL